MDGPGSYFCLILPSERNWDVISWLSAHCNLALLCIYHIKNVFTIRTLESSGGEQLCSGRFASIDYVISVKAILMVF